MKKLLIDFFNNPKNLSAAVNFLGANSELVLFKRKSKSSYLDVRLIEYEEEKISVKDVKYISMLRDENFDEVYLIITGNSAMDKKNIEFMKALRIKKKLLILGDKNPTKTVLEGMLLNTRKWVVAKDIKESTKRRNVFNYFLIKTTGTNECKKNKKEEMTLYGIIGTYNEDDIIYATVKNAFAQGCERVFIIDNNSTDNTVNEAILAGAELIRNFETSYYYELLRIRIMNDAIEEISLGSSLDKIWWLWLDADEFPEGPDGLTIGQYLETLSSKYRIVGSNQINHFPTKKPYYIERYHPIDFMPFGEEFNAKTFVINHCKVWHWKHPLHKYIKGKPMIRAKSGFHMGYCSEILFEPSIPIITHHFPFRDKEKTYKRYKELCKNNGNTIARNKYNDNMSVKKESAISRRFNNLDYIYNQQWDRIYISPTPKNEKSKVGIKLNKYISNCPRWYNSIENSLNGK